MLHIAKAADWGGVEWYYDNAIAQNVPFDVIGLSYYAYWHGYLDELQTTWTASPRVRQADHGRRDRVPLHPGERRPDRAASFSTASELETGYAATPAGQAAMFRDML